MERRRGTLTPPACPHSRTVSSLIPSSNGVRTASNPGLLGRFRLVLGRSLTERRGARVYCTSECPPVSSEGFGAPSASHRLKGGCIPRSEERRVGKGGRGSGWR